MLVFRLLQFRLRALRMVMLQYLYPTFNLNSPRLLPLHAADGEMYMYSGVCVCVCVCIIRQLKNQTPATDPVLTGPPLFKTPSPSHRHRFFECIFSNPPPPTHTQIQLFAMLSLSSLTLSCKELADPCTCCYSLPAAE